MPSFFLSPYKQTIHPWIFKKDDSFIFNIGKRVIYLSEKIPLHYLHEISSTFSGKGVLCGGVVFVAPAASTADESFEDTIIRPPNYVERAMVMVRISMQQGKPGSWKIKSNEGCLDFSIEANAGRSAGPFLRLCFLSPLHIHCIIPNK